MITLHDRSYQIDYFFGWRYLFSERLRKQVSQKLVGRNLILRGLFLAGSLTGMLFTSIAAILLVMAICQLSA